jgi:hypothetical protein
MSLKGAADLQVRELFQWKGREALRLTNGVIELIVLTGGGHLVSLRFLTHEGRRSENVLWESPWETLDPVGDWTEDLARMYGSAEMGRFLAGYSGHTLCLDYFGLPSSESLASGLSLHGEAAITRWTVELNDAHCQLKATLPVRQLAFERVIRLMDRQSVVYVEETVSNERDVERLCDWVQHVTFGPGFLPDGVGSFIASAQRGITWPSVYENVPLLAPDCEFTWPFAPREDAYEPVDLRVPFHFNGHGFLVGLQLDMQRENEFLLAVNWASRFGIGYIFRRSDFAWMTVWEENHTRQSVPWNGRTVARGMEFGTSPLPMGEQLHEQRRSVFAIPTGCILPAHGKKTARYLIFLFEIPSHVESIRDVKAMRDEIIFYDNEQVRVFSLSAQGCESFLRLNAFIEPPHL